MDKQTRLSSGADDMLNFTVTIAERDATVPVLPQERRWCCGYVVKPISGSTRQVGSGQMPLLLARDGWRHPPIGCPLQQLSTNQDSSNLLTYLPMHKLLLLQPPAEPLWPEEPPARAVEPPMILPRRGTRLRQPPNRFGD